MLVPPKCVPHVGCIPHCKRKTKIVLLCNQLKKDSRLERKLLSETVISDEEIFDTKVLLIHRKRAPAPRTGNTISRKSYPSSSKKHMPYSRRATRATGISKGSIHQNQPVSPRIKNTSKDTRF